MVREDIHTIQQRDPSIASLPEAVLHPSLPALWSYRAAHPLYLRGHRIIPRLMSNFARFITGIEIHPGARLGKRLFIDHGSGVVIGETAVVGDDVTLYHQVTLGAVGWWHDNLRPLGTRRHPHIGDRVVIGANATLLGPIVVGDDAVIGAQALVIGDIPDGQRILATVAWPQGTSESDAASASRRFRSVPAPTSPSTNSLSDHTGRQLTANRESPMSKETDTQSAVAAAGSAASRRSVVVIGGGPGGSTAAALLARGGTDVLLLERDVFPRYHIGESLAASCRVIMGLSGAVDRVDSFGFPVKRGALLQWGGEDDWTVDWNDLFGAETRSWHVDRDQFDEILMTNAEDQGAEVVQDATVKKVVFEEDRPVAVEWVRNSDPNRLLTTSFEFLIDASGRAGVLSAKKFRNRHAHEIFRNVAIWGYWQGGTTLPNTPEGGINIISSSDGWYWVIPLKDQRFSVGFVTHKNNFLKRREEYGSNEEMLLRVVDEHETVRSLLKEGRYYAPVRIEQDFSYVADRFCGPNYFLVGDAACFLDPLLSTGVHLAMYSAMLASGVILSNMAGEVGESQGRAFYESLYRHAYARLLVLVSGVYEQYEGKASYFWLAQRMVKENGSAEKPNHAFVELTTGLTDISDAEDAGGWSGSAGLNREMELARERADEQMAHSGRPGIAVFRLEPSDLYDEATGLYLVTSPRLGLRQTA